MPLKLASLNIEGNKHFDKFLPFFKNGEFDAICLQEVFARDVPRIREELGMEAHFAPNTLILYDKGDPISHAPMGNCIFSKTVLKDPRKDYYYGTPDNLPFHGYRDEKGFYRVLVHGVVEKEDVGYHIGTTHFMVTENGMTTDFQRRDLAEFLKLCDSFPDITVCGDFNAPRGQEIFDGLAAHFTDNIPQEYTSSLDPLLHRAGKLGLMVDGLFTTPGYLARNVKLNSGISDHLGITAEIEKA